MGLTKVTYSMINGATANVLDFGADATGSDDSTTAFQNALDSNQSVYVPDGYYKLEGTLELNSGNFIFGSSPTGASFGDNDYPQTAHLIFTGSGTACFISKDSANPLLHGGVLNMTIETSSRDWIFDLDGAASFRFNGLRMENQFATGGGLRSTKIDPIANNPTWLNVMIDTEIRVLDSSTAYAMDIDWSDSDFSCCTFTGGKGVIDRGPGNTKYNNCQFERANSSSAGLTLTSYSTASYKPTVVTGCCFDANNGYGLIIDGTSLGGSTYAPSIVGCAFRNYSADVTYEILLKNTSGSVVYGGVIASCSFVNDARTPINFDETIWQKLNWTSNFHAKNFTSLLDVGTNETYSILDRQGFNLPEGLAVFNGANTVRGMTGVSTYSSGPSSSFAGLMTGSKDGASPFIAASRDGSGTASNLNFVTDNTIRVQLLANGSSFWPAVDNVTSLGFTGQRWSVVYAATGTINTSDGNQKQDIENLNDAEKRVAMRIKSLIKKFRFKNAIEQKGNDARIHVGVIAQDVKAAFKAEGLDASKYGMFCSDMLEDGSVQLGVRYDELLAFVISTL